MRSNALIIFIKNPIKGHVKTRLAADLGEARALEVYHQLLGHTRRVSLKIDADRYLYYSEVIDPDDGWKEGDFHKREQEGNDLGERMKRAFEEVMQDHQQTIIIGSDCPGLKSQHIHDAFHALDNHDFVIGPSVDGGYYLLGMSSFYPAVFDHIPWSTNDVLTATEKVIEDLGGTRTLLPRLNDIDTLEDLKAYPSFYPKGGVD